jgi:AraC-like DNA-binding protein
MNDTLSLVIEEFNNPSGLMPICYQKRAEGLWPLVSFANPSFFFARCASSFEIRSPVDASGRVLDAYSIAIIAPNIPVQFYGNSAISDGVYLSASNQLIQEVCERYSIDFMTRLQTISSLAILPRTNWLNEIMHRYVYERVDSNNQDNIATRFLEQEIVKEIHYRIGDYAVRDKSRFDLDGKATDLRNPTLRAAMTFIESHLFRDITVEDISKKIGISESTLLREFQARLGKSPTAYIIDRRLEEAMILIKSQRYAIGQVSDIVGYENLSAFSAAFKKKFGLTPSQVAVKDPVQITKL